MKRFSFCLFLTSLLIAGCHRSGDDPDNGCAVPEFSTRTLTDSLHYELTGVEDYPFNEGPVPVEYCYSVEWPEEGIVSPSVEKELLYVIFGDSSSADVTTAARKWLEKSTIYEEEGAVRHKQEHLDKEQPYSYSSLSATWSRNENLITYHINWEGYFVGAAHGMYTYRNAILDLEKGRLVKLCDLLTDTAQLREVVVKAVEELDVNKQTRETLHAAYEEIPPLPIPEDFTIDSTRSVITLIYQVYDIASYAEGMQFIELPIFWLSKQIPLTEYGKELFGPDAYIEE